MSLDRKEVKRERFEGKGKKKKKKKIRERRRDTEK